MPNEKLNWWEEAILKVVLDFLGQLANNATNESDKAKYEQAIKVIQS